MLTSEQKQISAANKALSMTEIIDAIRESGIKCSGTLTIVGKWLWIKNIDSVTEDEHRLYIMLGFNKNDFRRAYQHSCGTGKTRPCKHGDPRKYYGERELN